MAKGEVELGFFNLPGRYWMRTSRKRSPEARANVAYRRARKRESEREATIETNRQIFQRMASPRADGSGSAILS